MPRKSLLAVTLALAVLALPLLVAGDTRQPVQAIDVLFSPNGGCTNHIVAEIGQARESVQVQAYSFTSARIVKAVLEAKKRGVASEVILDSSQDTATYSELDFFVNQGVPVLIDRAHAIAHNKIILIDGSTVITGSFNFTNAAEERNAENLLIIKGHDDLADQCVRSYAAHRVHSHEYAGRHVGSALPRAPPVTTESPAQQTAGTADDPIVYVGTTGTKYHRERCSSLRKAKISMNPPRCLLWVWSATGLFGARPDEETAILGASGPIFAKTALGAHRLRRGYPRQEHYPPTRNIEEPPLHAKFGLRGVYSMTE